MERVPHRLPAKHSVNDPPHMTPPLVVIACDPGGRQSGLVVRQGSHLVDYEVLESTHPSWQLPTMDYVNDVIAWIAARDAQVYDELGFHPAIAAEGLKVPEFPRDAETGQRNRVQPASVMGLTMVYTGVRVAFPEAIEVPPGGHGLAPFSTYPPELVGPRERRGGGVRRHLRAAWDIAGQARLALAIRRSTR